MLTFSTCAFVNAGQHYTEKSGECASQGYLHVVLEDVQSGGRQLVVATTHLKAKEGADMDEIRLRQVRFCRNLHASTPTLGLYAHVNVKASLDWHGPTCWCC